MKLIGSVLLVTCVLAAQSPQSRYLSNAPLSTNEFSALANRCAPRVPSVNLLAIAQTESALRPNAISLNYPARTASAAGYPGYLLLLARQPIDRYEALRWMHWLTMHNHTVSVGLLQVNVEHAGRFQVSADELFDPCTNIRIGATILSALYSDALKAHRDPQQALLAAISAYNTGSIAGLNQSYVGTVLSHARANQ